MRRFGCYFFDVSMALGAFLAGMVVGQSEFGAAPPPKPCRSETRSR